MIRSAACRQTAAGRSRRSVQWFFSRGFLPLLWRELRDLEVLLGSRTEIRREIAPEPGLKPWAECDLEHRPRGRVLSQDVPDRPLAVEQRAERTAREDAVVEA